MEFCTGCARSLRPVGPVRLESGLLVGARFAHEGPIRSAVHALKYRGIERVAAIFAPFLADLLPTDTSVLVPIPRTLGRRIRYGVDPGRVLAREVARCTGLPVMDVLRAPIHRTSQLKIRRAEGLRFDLVGRIPHRAVLIDDVLTTGATMAAAAASCGGIVTRGVTLTRSSTTARTGPSRKTS